MLSNPSQKYWSNWTSSPNRVGTKSSKIETTLVFPTKSSPRSIDQNICIIFPPFFLPPRMFGCFWSFKTISSVDSLQLLHVAWLWKATPILKAQPNRGGKLNPIEVNMGGRYHGRSIPCIPKDLGVSKNRGTPKSSILIGFSDINHPFWGTIILGNIHLFSE